MKLIYTSILLIFFSSVSLAQQRYLYAILEGAQEVPANASTASGVVIVKYNSTNRLLELWGDYDGLSSTATASHIHAPGAAGINAPVLFPLTNTAGTAGTLSTNVTLSLAQEADLLTGNMYVNVHTPIYPGGEIRGQLLEATNGQTVFFSGSLQGAQEVPPNASTATGSIRTLLDKSLNKIYSTGSFIGLSSAAYAAHVHTAAPTVAGPIVTALTFTAATSGSLHTVATISGADATQMLSGNSYVNVHTATYPGGEIRGQLLQENNQRYAQATLQGSQEVPATGSTATGTVIAKYNTGTKLLELNGVFTNLSSAISASHIHAPAAPGTNAPVMFPINFTGTTNGTLTLSVTLTAPQESDFLNGRMYVNVHNPIYPGGEIRGQLLTTSAGNTYYLTSNIQGSQEVPSNASTATGSAQLLLDIITKQVWLSGSFSGLAMPASAGHIHQGAAGINGDAIVTLTATNAVAGTINGNATVTAAFADQVIAGNSYINIHNASFPGGEIRGQFGNVLLPLKLLYFNGFKQQDKVVLQWATANEINFSHFELEQMDNATGTWKSKSNITAKGAGLGNNYQEIDIPAGNKTDFVFYRLKMIDADGHFSYSQVIKIGYGRPSMLMSLEKENTGNGSITVTITGSPDGKNVPATIIDYMGRAVMQTLLSTRQKNQVNVSRLASGMYQIIVRTNEGILKSNFINF